MSTEPVEDYLMEDAELPSQKVVLLSFLSPEKILANKDIFMFKNFVKDYEMQWKTSKFEGWLAQQISEVNSKLEALASKLPEENGKDVLKNLLRPDHR